jgi:hypothetical protein
MRSSLPGLLALALVLLLSIRVTSSFFRVDKLMAFAVSPLLLIALSSVVHNAIVKLDIGSITFSSSSKVALVLWCLYCVISYSIREKDVIASAVVKSNSVDYSLVATYLLSVTAWIIGLGFSSNHPTDNDALTNAFLLRRFADIPDKALCMVPGDVSRIINMRFESCGGYILAHYSNLFGWAPWDKVLNNTYLLTALFLPIGAAACWQYFSGVRKHRWIAAAASTTFLVYPYALNGLSRLTLALAFTLPLIGLCISIEKRDLRQLMLISLSLIGLGYIHLLTLAIVLIFLAIVLVFKFITIPLEKSTEPSPILRAFGLCMRAGVVIPAYCFFGSNFMIRSSVINVLAATEVIPHSNLGTRFARESTATLFESPEAVTILKVIFFGSNWTRAQPLIFVLVLIGIFLLLRQAMSYAPLLFFVAATYSLFIVTAIWDTDLGLYHFIFLNNWYRLYAVMVIFCIIPVAVSISHLTTHYSMNSRGRLLLTTCLMAYLLSLATGASIVHTAWNRATNATAEIMNQFDGLKPFANNRTLNDPKDGSSWAYSRSGLKLLSPNDRGTDLQLANKIDLLVDEKSRLGVCPFLIDQQVAAVLSVGESLRKIEILLQAGVVDRIAFESKDVKLGLLSPNFLSTCKSTIDGQETIKRFG